MSVHINRDEWLAALREAELPMDDDQEAVTAAEFAQMFGLTRLSAERRLARLAEMGKAIRTYKRARSKNGRMFSLIAYRLAP